MSREAQEVLQSIGKASDAFFCGKTHEEALARLEYLVDSGATCGIITGPAGTGKTSVLRAFAREVRPSARPILVDATSLSGAQLLQGIVESLGVTSHADARLSQLWLEVADALAGQALAGRRCILMIDHLDRAGADCAQVLQRLLASSSSTKCAVLILAFSGLALPSATREWRTWCDLPIDVAPLGGDETASFIQTMLGWLNLPVETIAPSAREAIHRQAGGVVRDVLRLCERALLAALYDEKPSVSADLVEAARHELGRLRFSA